MYRRPPLKQPIEWKWRNPFAHLIDQLDRPFVPCKTSMCGAWMRVDWAYFLNLFVFGGLAENEGTVPEGYYDRITVDFFGPCERCGQFLDVTFDYKTKKAWQDAMWTVGLRSFDAISELYDAFAAFANGTLEGHDGRA